MPKLSWRSFAMAVAVMGTSTLAEAQTRTWVSGVGDDVNPCSRTAPCKTFAGAISKTAAGGEINVLDPGGYGAVTITKSISIVSVGHTAGVLATVGTNGIIVNAGVNDNVVLRGLDINGGGTGGNGIRMLAGASLTVEDCQIYGFTGRGIDVVTSTASQVFVKDTVIRNNPGASGGGILLSRTGAGSVMATIDRVRLERNRFGVRVEDAARATVRDSSASNNGTNGFVAFSAGGASTLTLEHSLAADNTNNGVSALGAAATVRLSNTTVVGNGTGLNAGGGAIVSFGNNQITGNGVDGAPTTTVLQQ
jgi:hypothetical protein